MLGRHNAAGRRDDENAGFERAAKSKRQLRHTFNVSKPFAPYCRTSSRRCLSADLSTMLKSQVSASHCENGYVSVALQRGQEAQSAPSYQPKSIRQTSPRSSYRTTSSNVLWAFSTGDQELNGRASAFFSKILRTGDRGRLFRDSRPMAE